MKRNITIPVIIIFVLMNFYSCTKDTFHRILTNPTTYTSYIKVVHAAPAFTQVFNMPDNFNVVVGGVNGLRVAAAFTYNSAFPANTLNTDTYAAVPSGSQDIRLVLKGVVNIDSSVTAAIIPKNLDPGNFYTLIITDSISSSNYSAIWTQDVFPTPAAGTYSIRFIHAVMNDTAGKKVDVYSTKQAATIFTNVSPGAVTGFSSLPYVTGDTIIVRRAGTAFELDRFPRSTAQVPAQVPVAYTNNQRVYTILYKGNAVSTAGTKGRSIIVFNNR